MTNLRNRVQLIGNLGLAPEIFEFDGGKKKAKLSIATNETYRNQKGELVKEVKEKKGTLKAGLEDLVKAFMESDRRVLCSLPEHIDNHRFYQKMGNYKD